VKRILFMFVLMAMFATLSSAVIPMVFAGLGNTWVSGSDAEYAESVFGFMAGAAMEVDASAPLLMEYGARYRTSGFKYTYEEYDYYSGYEYEAEESYSMSFLDMFAKAKYEMPLGNMYLLPYMGYAMGILLTAEAEWSGGNYSHTADVKEYFNSLNHSLLFGADVLIAEKFTLGIEYNLGLSNIIKEGSDSWNISALMFKAGMSF